MAIEDGRLAQPSRRTNFGEKPEALANCRIVAKHEVEACEGFVGTSLHAAGVTDPTCLEVAEGAQAEVPEDPGTTPAAAKTGVGIEKSEKEEDENFDLALLSFFKLKSDRFVLYPTTQETNHGNVHI